MQFQKIRNSTYIKQATGREGKKLFAHESNIIKHFETICSVDQGTMVNPKVNAALRIVKNAMEAREGDYPSFRWMDGTELGLLNGANLGLSGDDFRIYQTSDLNGYAFSRRGAEIVIDYLADLLKEYFWYAQRELEAQKKTKSAPAAPVKPINST